LNNSDKHVAVAGAGIVGVSCALWLQQKGFKVTLIDGNEPGSITSSGNACAIADYGCIPVNDPGLLKRLPGLIFKKDSPLSISPWYALTHLPWLLSFLIHCSPGNVNRTINALGALLKHTSEGLDPLIEITGTDDLFVRNGCLYVYDSAQGLDNARRTNQARADQGVEFSELSRDEIHDLEPNLNKRFQKGIIFRNARQVVNPKTLVSRYFDTFMANGGHFVSDRAQGILHGEDGIKILMHSYRFLRADKIVISAGAFSRQIELSDAEKLPLDTERGYHIQYAEKQHLANRPIAWPECGFYATPMNEGLRFAGTVELAGLSDKKNQARIDYLVQKSREMFKLDGPPTSDWLGFRPTLPDSLPVIGGSRRFPDTYYAFGHQHIGLTLAGITGKLISELISTGEPSVDISPFSPDRFMKKLARRF
jgi:D-amino-acid dehydrogenase